MMLAPISGMKSSVSSFADDVLDAAAEKLSAGGVDHQITALQIFDEDSVGCALGDAAQKRQIFFQFAGADQQLVLHDEQPPTRRSERDHHQMNDQKNCSCAMLSTSGKTIAGISRGENCGEKPQVARRRLAFDRLFV